MPAPTKTQGATRFHTPAKITPILRVGVLRDDGFHDVSLVMVPVSLYDILEWIPGAATLNLQVESGEQLGAPGQNLVLRAAQAFARTTGRALLGTLHLRKAIPSAAGLGGGSGNAAGTLLLLNQVHGEPLRGGQLETMALELGSDVPFFLHPRPCWAGGRGERLEPLADYPTLWLLVVKPPLAIATAEAYHVVDHSRAAAATQAARRLSIPGAGSPRPALTSVEQVVQALANDFEAALLPLHPELGWAKQALLQAGALGAMLTGSGSALFGVFGDARSRDVAARTLTVPPGWNVLPCRTLAGHDYGVEPVPS
ncbi:MAG TPA: 4-(cytidine 5'-diphospho)-2-C-methyl-D-erythritol kinase [bacterium]|nr:4-(cytidine 5'-diphospho)-2-C-methyl-D-erythritol kinase [bacterium]